MNNTTTEEKIEKTDNNLIKKTNPEKPVYWELFKVFALAALIAFPIRVFAFQPFAVSGSSMEPNFLDGERLIVKEWGYKNTWRIGQTKILSFEKAKDLERGDVVVFSYPKDPDVYYIKRVVGLPGEKVTLEDGRVKIFTSEKPEGFFLNEKEYLANFIKTEEENKKDIKFPVELKEDEYFVLGDNRLRSSDSRYWGPLPKSYVIGKVVSRYWPVDKVNSF